MIILVERLDGGGPQENGHFRCTAEGCGWQSARASRKAPSKHVRTKHEGCKCKVQRLVPLLRVSREEKEVKARARKQRFRDRALAATEESGGWERRDGGTAQSRLVRPVTVYRL